MQLSFFITAAAAIASCGVLANPGHNKVTTTTKKHTTTSAKKTTTTTLVTSTIKSVTATTSSTTPSTTTADACGPNTEYPNVQGHHYWGYEDCQCAIRVYPGSTCHRTQELDYIWVRAGTPL